MEFLGISGSELLLILVVAVIIIGPRHAAQALVWLKKAIDWLRAWSAKLREQTAETEDGLKVDLSGLDPRQYDPRRMIKDAVAEEMQLWMEQAAGLEKTTEGALLKGKPATQATPETATTTEKASEGAIEPGETAPEEPASPEQASGESIESAPKPNPATASLDHIQALMKASQAKSE